MYLQRARKQATLLKLPAYLTTTIGSFPQTAEIRHARSAFKAVLLDNGSYKKTAMQAAIARSVREEERNDIIASIADMDADVTTIETSRSDMDVLDAFDNFNYLNEIEPSVYEIYSPNIPTQEHIV